MKYMIDCGSDYKPGDLPPEGYLAWHEWAEVQLKAGIKQVECGKCGAWKTPQELSGEFTESTLKRFTKKPPFVESVKQRSPICSKCHKPTMRITETNQ